jgi:hypothetical protein
MARSLASASGTAAITATSRSDGTTTTPFSSPRTASPGRTTMPPTVTGTCVSPREPNTPARGVAPVANTGKPSRACAATSRQGAPSTTPTAPRLRAERVVFSPQKATEADPAPSTTITSPGSERSMASKTAASSVPVGRAVTARPSRRAPTHIGRTSAPIAFVRPIASARTQAKPSSSSA